MKPAPKFSYTHTHTPVLAAVHKIRPRISTSTTITPTSSRKLILALTQGDFAALDGVTIVPI